LWRKRILHLLQERGYKKQKYKVSKEVTELRFYNIINDKSRCGLHIFIFMSQLIISDFIINFYNFIINFNRKSIEETKRILREQMSLEMKSWTDKRRVLNVRVTCHRCIDTMHGDHASGCLLSADCHISANQSFFSVCVRTRNA